MQNSDQIAIIGPTASGKSALAVELAHQHNGIILSLDSLSIYKEIDIASAKPSIEERGGIEHFGIDVVYPDEHFDVTDFVDLYKKAKNTAEENGKKLIVVGGTGFYLKMLIDGISPLPDIDENIERKVDDILSDLPRAYSLLSKVDNEYAKQIEPSDRYRIEKALLIYFATDTAPSKYFAMNPPEPMIEGDMPIYEITIDRDTLRKKIVKRADQMLSSGLIDEVSMLERRYGRMPTPMRAIGIREVLYYFDGVYGYDQMREKIIINTARLAKRQRTFNKSQFDNTIQLDISD